MEATVEEQKIFDEYTKIIHDKTSHMDDSEFLVWSFGKMLFLYRYVSETTARGDKGAAKVWSIQFEALFQAIEKRNVEERENEPTPQDYRWTLVYVAKDKHYRLGETQLINNEWVVTRSVWNHMSEALDYIRQTNVQRKRPITH